MSVGIIELLTIFLHTPLMSGSNAIHGIILVGTMTIMGEAHGTVQVTLGFFAVLLATLNIVGGFVVTDRMLEMFKGKPSDKGKAKATATATATASAQTAKAQDTTAPGAAASAAPTTPPSEPGGGAA